MLGKLFDCFKSKKALPDYVRYEDDLSYPAPIVIEKAALSCFLLKLDSDRVNALLKKTFSDPSHGSVQYVPLTNYAFVVLGDMPTLYSSSVEIGSTSERELTIWILAAAVDTNTSDKRISRLVLFPAYVIADDPYSLVSGRESLGFFKSWGQLTGVEAGAQSPASLSVSVFGHETKGDHAGSHPVIEFTQGKAAAGEFSAIASLEDVLEHLLDYLRSLDDFFHPQYLPEWSLFEQLFRDMWRSEFPIVLLKQIRDSGSRRAVYQAILESQAKINRFDDFQYLGKYDFSLQPIFSFRPDETLGLPSVKDSCHGFRVVLDFQINGGTEIWKA